MITTTESKWDIGSLSDGSGIYVAVGRIPADQHLYVKLSPQEALKIGEAIIKSAMPQNFDKEHLREITKPYPVNLDTLGGS